MLVRGTVRLTPETIRTETQIWQIFQELGADHLAKPQRLTDSVYESHKGRPVDDVLNELQRVSGELKIGLTRKQLLPYAEAISAGREVVWKVQDGSSQ